MMKSIACDRTCGYKSQKEIKSAERFEKQKKRINSLSEDGLNGVSDFQGGE